jgi:DNA-binding FrmR family transcriptional regulator
LRGRALTVRVRKVGGQLRAIERMIEEDRDCAEILNQLVSARRGLKSLAEAVIQGHLRHCVGESRSSAEAQRKLRDLLTVLERYVE